MHRCAAAIKSLTLMPSCLGFIGLKPLPGGAIYVIPFFYLWQAWLIGFTGHECNHKGKNKANGAENHNWNEAGRPVGQSPKPPSKATATMHSGPRSSAVAVNPFLDKNSPQLQAEQATISIPRQSDEPVVKLSNVVQYPMSIAVYHVLQLSRALRERAAHSSRTPQKIQELALYA